MRRGALIVVGLILLAPVLPAQESGPLVRIMSGSTFGGGNGEYLDRYEARSGTGLAIGYVHSGLPYLGGVFRTEVQRSAVRTDNSEYDLQMIRAELGAQARLPIGNVLAPYIIGTAGYGGGRITPEPEGFDTSAAASSFVYSVGVGLEIVIGGLVASADVGFDAMRGIYEGIAAHIGIGWQFGGVGVRGTQWRRDALPVTPQPLTARANLSYSDFSVEPIFPVLYKYYDQEPVGTVTLTNDGDETIEDVEVVLDMETYIDNPKVSQRFASIAPGESVQVPLAALFNEQVRSITEGEKVSAVLRTEYKIGEVEGVDEETVTIDFYDRNAIRWDDDRKVAAFVTTRDSELQPLARNLAALARQNRREAVSSNFQLAVMMYLGMVDQGLAYVVDPSSAYAQLSQNPLVIDFVQFPRQTLNYRGGDCDDLSVTFATLMESVGVSTAFLTIPGHLFVAFELDLSPEEASRTFGRPEDLIFREDGTVWVPVEITLLEGGFIEAWTTGAQQWREYDAQGLAGFVETAAAWSTFQPVAYTGDEQVRPFNENLLETVFNEQMNGFVKREIADRELTLKERLADRPENVRLRNRLGVLYSRYGLTHEARQTFEEVLEYEEYAPSLANLGNIEFLSDEFDSALGYYQAALESDPANEAGLLGVARVSHELENYGTVRSYYDQLKQLNPDVADQFAYLELRGEAAARASDAAQMSGRVYWQEETEE